LIFNALHYFALRSQLDYGIDQLSSRQVSYGGLEHAALKGRNDIGHDDNQAGVQFHVAEKPNEVDVVIRNDVNSSLAIRLAALRDQLGLRLESTKGPFNTLVIDHIQRPSENRLRGGSAVTCSVGSRPGTGGSTSLHSD
jgi:hypothetical protein